MNGQVAAPPNAQGSIRRRLLVSLLAGAATLAVVVYFMVLAVARQVAQESQDNILSASAVSILDSARFSAGQIAVDLPYSALSMLDSISDERVFYTIRLGDEFLSGYPDLPEAAADTARNAAYLSAPFLGEDVRIATMRRSISTDLGQQFLQVSVAQTLSGQKQVLARISRTSIALGSGVFALLGVLALVIARSTIGPLDRLAASVSRRGPQDLRPFTAAVPSEMVPLVASLNSLMGRLQTSLSRSEDFITEAAHRVRTPLAIVRTKAEIVNRRAQEAETRVAVGEMIHAIDESSRTAGQLLDHAMVAFRLDNLSTEEVDLCQLACETVERVGPIAELKGISITTSATGSLTIRGDRILLQNAMHNLLDNAIKYSPPGSAITVDVLPERASPRLRICDTGPGFPEAELLALTERFTRGANAEGVVGSGLGLTIARDVIEAHGGRMETINNPEGGACVSLFFPPS